MVQQVKVPTTKFSDLNLVLRTHMVERETQSSHVSYSLSYTHATCIHKHTNSYNKSMLVTWLALEAKRPGCEAGGGRAFADLKRPLYNTEVLRGGKWEIRKLQIRKLQAQTMASFLGYVGLWKNQLMIRIGSVRMSRGCLWAEGRDRGQAGGLKNH